MEERKSILIIYTGGTIGMKIDPTSGALVPFNFNQISSEVPELGKFGYRIDTISYSPLIDSSDVQPSFWQQLADTIEENYDKYNGFVILHGTDTMSFSASALSFMLDDLEKPVVFTGSQLPIGMLRTDGKENLISSVEIAAGTDENGHAMVPEVCIYFDSMLYRGNRTTKYNAEYFRAFRSPNYPVLAHVGIHIKYETGNIRYPLQWGKKLKVKRNLSNKVAVLKLFPGISEAVVDAVIGTQGVKALVLETFGSGNAPTSGWFIERIKYAVSKGIMVVNITQCLEGKVDMGTYATGVALRDAGVIGGADMTFEATIAKLFFLLGQETDMLEIRRLMATNMRGEV